MTLPNDERLQRVTRQIRRDLIPLPGSPPRPVEEEPSPPQRETTKRSVYLTYKERVHLLSERVVKAQRPIQILDSIKWKDDIAQFLVEKCFRELPAVDASYYAAIPLRFDAAEKISEFDDIERETGRLLGETDPIGAILVRNCRQYKSVVRMLLARGTQEFYAISKELYGSPKDLFGDDATSLCDLGVMMYDVLVGLRDDQLGESYPKNLTAEQAVAILNEGFLEYFQDDSIRAKLDDGILSDAAAGADYVKVKRDAMFSVRDVEILEVHEGWVHVGTTRNGMTQHVATWLAKGPPCTTATQEGLAVLMEVLSFVSLPARLKKLNNRILAIDKAEDGADLLDVIEFYRTEGLSEQQCIQNAQRVFRGGLVEGGAPFTKDLSYCRGLVENYNFLQTCVRFGRPELIPFLFAGKVTLEDVPVLYEKWREGVVDRPRHVPRQFLDLNGLAVWLAYSNFFDRIDLRKVQARLKSVIFPK